MAAPAGRERKPPLWTVRIAAGRGAGRKALIRLFDNDNDKETDEMTLISRLTAAFAVVLAVLAVFAVPAEGQPKRLVGSAAGDAVVDGDHNIYRVHIGGPVTVEFHFDEGRVEYEINRISNDSSVRDTGPLHVGVLASRLNRLGSFGERWIMDPDPIEISGTTEGRLPAGYHTRDVKGSGPYTSPPPGTYYLWVIVSEGRNLQSLTNLDAVLLEDTLTVDPPPPPPPVDLEITLSAARTTLTEGESTRLTATANRPVNGDVRIRLEKGFTLHPGSLNDVRVDDIVIRSGQSSGSTELTAIDDGRSEGVDGREILALRGRWSGDVTNTLEITILDAATPPPGELSITLSANRTTLTEGQSATLTFTANRAVTEDLTVEVRWFPERSTASMPADATANPAVIRSGRTEGATTLTTVSDGLTEGTETLLLKGAWDNLSKLTDNDLTITIQDAATPPPPPPGGLTIDLSVYGDDNIVEGTSATLWATANRAVTEDLTIEIVPVAGSASSSDIRVDSIVIESGNDSGWGAVAATQDGVYEAEPETVILEGRWSNRTTNRVTVTIWEGAVSAVPVAAALLLAATLWCIGRRRMARGR